MHPDIIKLLNENGYITHEQAMSILGVNSRQRMKQVIPAAWKMTLTMYRRHEVMKAPRVLRGRPAKQKEQK